jgi:multicomponent Na+:H+ antiporter subunit B
MGKEIKKFRIITICLIIIICALFIYIADDIPNFGDPNAPPIKFVEILRVELNQESDLLDQNKIPYQLLSELTNRGFPIPVRIEKSSEYKDEWNGFIIKEEPHYEKEEKYYFIKKEDSFLKVYRYAFVVRWIEKGLKETAVPNMVTYGLADYRGYDTLGETTVIFTAGVSVILLLRRKSRL